MGSILATLAMLYGGWKNWPWLSPIYALLILTPMTVYGLLQTKQWRTEAGLSSHINWSNIAIFYIVNLVVFYAAFAAARGLRNYLQNKKQN